MNKEIVNEKYKHAIDSCESDYGKYFLSKLFDLDITYTEDTCTVEFDVEDFMYNPMEVLHGGVIAFVLDVSMGHLCKKVVGAAVTVEMKIQYMKAIKTGKLTCTAMFLKKGRNISFLESKMIDAEGNIVAFATGTFAKVKQQ
ncbi:hypothetical protein M670_04707 [Schinkia azotoformans MEV2011]|uniref:Thioesterase domain-containing protein n=1 Tax=Schinkia azotoformans MEV2011 TaxID=1348973 RepID=A0A072NSD8_SCHAZ|nr:PaaI family thioesterase [Schinkia azotoformans]KEF36110.1 hypothetical protein M670_04707 [Schinkia azotoformans MEV2011]MEC1695518.1 PaaI family thioesterase [Schinkia azotoformans]MEC1718604.1 PaaI family thioesterase [Schinkia azotoformans]MEC1727167.1 PaaI family thioesterase [Schinkia azotoformans]MEC1743586.1 PaaI family thioesterase [Schinkia azotoformans]